jgi:hypothetical protein
MLSLPSTVSSENLICGYSVSRVCIHTYLCIDTYFFKRDIFFIFFIFLEFLKSVISYNNVILME